MSRVRIIGGQWRSRQIEVPESTGLRPTPDRVRETLFNWLGQDLTGLRCLDLFAGSGALGLEAASRGAAEVVMVENTPRVVAYLQNAIAKLNAAQVRLLKGDAVRFARSTAERFDLIFLDPPYNQALLDTLAPCLEKLLLPGGRVYAEAEKPILRLGALSAVRAGRAGQVHYQLLCFEDQQ